MTTDRIRAGITRRIGPGGLPRTVANQFRSGHFGVGARKAGY